MKKVKLGDVATYINGYAFKPTDWSNEGVLIIRIQDLTGNSYQANRYNGNYAKKYEVQKGDVLISWSASLGVYVWQGETAVLNQHIFKVLFDKVEIDKNFFVHQVECILKNASSEAHGATMKHLTKPVFDALPFYLPSLEEQKAIAGKLDKVSGLIEKRKTQLEKLDLLIKSRFIEMFTPFLSKQKTLLDNLCETITKGTTPTTLGFDFIDNGINFIKIENISANEKIDTTNMLHISEECNIKLKRSILKENDILFSIAGTKMGITAKVTSDVLPANTNQALAIIRLKKEAQMNVDFLIELLHSDMIIEQIESMKSTVAQTNLSLDNIKNFKVIIPPISLQNEFAEFVKLIDKSKFKIQKSLEKLEILKKSLMQQYFG